MTADTFEVGGKQGPRQVHLTPPGFHPLSWAEAKQRFAWSPERAGAWPRFVSASVELRERFGATVLAGVGSYFTTDFSVPGDLEVVAFYDRQRLPTPSPRDRSAFEAFNRGQGDTGVHAYAYDASLFFPGGPGPLVGFTHAAPHPRPRQMTLGGPQGPEVGVVLLNLEELGAG